MEKAVLPAFNRLFDAKMHWQNADANYFEPNTFRIAINACIQELRNVTFVLQSHKREIKDFDILYSPWQKKMKENKSLRWLLNSRNRIVKQGDLQLSSILKVSIVGSYLDEEVPIFKKSFDPMYTNIQIHQFILKTDIPNSILKDSYIKIERQWIDKNYSNFEIINLLGKCWSALGEVLFDIYNQDNKNNLKQVLPPCMYKDSENRASWMKLGEDNLVPITLKRQNLEFNNKNVAKMKKRYGESPIYQQTKLAKNFKNFCDLLFEQAMFMLQKDKYHRNISFILKDSTPIQIIEVNNEDQADKYRTMRLLASDVEKYGANEFILISEIWIAPYDPNEPYQRASESKEKQEALSLIGISKKGDEYSFTVPFKRDKRKIIFGEIVIDDIEGLNIIQPILQVWEKDSNKIN